MAGMHSVSRGLWVPATELVASIDVILKPLSDLFGLSKSGFLKLRLLNDDLKKRSRCDSPAYSPRVHLALTDFRAIRTMLQDNNLLTAGSPLLMIECNPCVYSFFLSQRDTSHGSSSHHFDFNIPLPPGPHPIRGRCQALHDRRHTHNAHDKVSPPLSIESRQSAFLLDKSEHRVGRFMAYHHQHWPNEQDEG
jgi:hypothetical protein